MSRHKLRAKRDRARSPPASSSGTTRAVSVDCYSTRKVYKRQRQPSGTASAWCRSRVSLAAIEHAKFRRRRVGHCLPGHLQHGNDTVALIPRSASSALSTSTTRFRYELLTDSRWWKPGSAFSQVFLLLGSDVAAFYKYSTTSRQGSGEVEAIGVHRLVPRRHEVLHEFLLGVRARIDLRERASCE